MTAPPKAVAAYLASIGAKGGSTKSKAKAKASRENGKLGGRPRKAKPAKERTK